MSSRWFLFFGLTLLFFVFWLLLGFWLPRGSERFYLLVPPAFLAGFVTAWPHPWQELRDKARPILIYLACLTGVCTAYNLFLVYLMFPVSLTDLPRALSLREILLAVYLIIALRLLIELPLRLLKKPDRGSRGTEAAGRWSQLLRRNLLALLLAALISPFILAVLYVHRFKVPNIFTPSEITGRPFEDVALTTSDGLVLRGWFLPAAQPSRRTLLICHGLGANRSNFLPFLVVGDALKANVLMFDFRGHGDSDGHTISFGFYEKFDVLAAVAYLRQQRTEQAQEVIGLGISMGTAGLIMAAAEVEPPLTALVIDSGFTAPVELTDNALAAVPAFVRPYLTLPGVPIASLHAGCWLYDVRPCDHVGRLRAPVLFIHAREDKLIPVNHSQRLFEQAADPKALWLTDTGGHGSSLRAQEEYLRRVGQLVSAARQRP